MIDLVALGAETKTPEELAALAEQLRQAAIDADHLRLAKLQRGRNIIDLPIKPAMGAYRTTLRPSARGIDPVAIMKKRHHDDPARLTEIVNEIARFTDNLERIVTAAVDWADTCQIDEDVYVPIITKAVKALPRKGQQNAG